MNYYKDSLKKYFNDKSYIFKFQKKGDTLVLGNSMKNLIKRTKSKKIFADVKHIPRSWHINLPGKHNLENIICAIEVARTINIDEEIIKKAIKHFNPVSGRLEFVKSIKGIDIYNDNNSTTPEATGVALIALGKIISGKKNIILIMGGFDKNLELKKLVENIKKYVKEVVLIPGTGTNRISPMLHKIKKLPIHREKNLKDAVLKAYSIAEKGDIILFSPAFASFGMFHNEYDRGDQFMKIIKTLK
jgi:UDP-N-acetylmuramoylalanine--D-glutamate ligase